MCQSQAKPQGGTFLPTSPQESPCLLSLSAKDLLLSTHCLNHDPTCNAVSALQKALSCQETNHRQVNTRKPDQRTAERPPSPGKICVFAAFLVTVPKYPIRATGGRGWCQPEVLRVRKAWQPGLEAAGHLASAQPAEINGCWRSACFPPFSFLFSLN